LLNYVRSQALGNPDEYGIKTVYGDKPLVYVDYTGSGKPLKFIENYLQD